MVSATNIDSLPPELLQHIASFRGTPFVASKQVMVKTSEVPYKEIYQSFSKTVGTAKCEALVESSIALEAIPTRTFHYSEEDKLRSMCSDLIEEANLLWGDKNHYLVSKKLGPVFSATEYQDLEKRIADENLLRLFRSLFKTEILTFTGSHAEQAGVARQRVKRKLDDALITRLELSNIGLTRIPPELYGLQNLHDLSLSKNQIKACNISAGAFPNLRYLNLQNNEISLFRVSEGSLPQLRVLDLGNNKLKHFCVESQAFPSLEALHLDRNKLRSFNHSSRLFRPLKCLDLRQNEITSFYAAKGTYPSLGEILLNDNPLEDLHIESGALNGVSQNDLNQLYSNLGINKIKPRNWRHITASEMVQAGGVCVAFSVGVTTTSVIIPYYFIKWIAS